MWLGGTLAPACLLLCASASTDIRIWDSVPEPKSPFRIWGDDRVCVCLPHWIGSSRSASPSHAGSGHIPSLSWIGLGFASLMVGNRTAQQIFAGSHSFRFSSAARSQPARPFVVVHEERTSDFPADSVGAESFTIRHHPFRSAAGPRPPARRAPRVAQPGFLSVFLGSQYLFSQAPTASDRFGL
jgi:hypothetical protein